MKKQWTIELNLDDDFSSTLAWHVDELDKTVETNLNSVINQRKTSNWAVVGLADSRREAHEKAGRIRKELCEKFGKESKSVDWDF